MATRPDAIPRTLKQWILSNPKTVASMTDRTQSSVVMMATDENQAAFLKVNDLFRQLIQDARESGMEFEINPNKSFRHHHHDMRKLESRDFVEALNRATSFKGAFGEDGAESADRARIKMLAGGYKGILQRFWERSIQVVTAHPDLLSVKLGDKMSFPREGTRECQMLAVTLLYAMDPLGKKK